MNNLKKFKEILPVRIRQKADGTIVETMLVALLGTVMSLAFLTVIFGAFKTVSDRWNMQQAAREAILLMETEGYLMPADAESLILALEEAGLTDISLAGTTVSEVPYGSRITLSVSGTYDQNVLAFADGFSGITTNPVRITITRSSTAKQ